MNINKYIKELERGSGYEQAFRIAQRAMENTNPRHWDSLPKGIIFFPSDVKNKTGYQERHLRKLHNWWTNVYYTMKKERDSKGKKK